MASETGPALAEPARAVMAPGRLVIRAAGGEGRGVGHVGRSIVLARAWQAVGGETALIVDPAVASRASALAGGIAIRVAPDALTVTSPETDWLAIDGYDLGRPAAERAGVPQARRIRIDDGGRSGDATAAVTIDQRPAGPDIPGPERPPDGTALLGLRYALVSPVGTDGRDRTAAPRHLVILLGGDPRPELVALLSAVLDRIGEGLEVDVLGGGDLSSFDGRRNTRVHGFADPAPLLARADVAVAAAGITTWDLCRHGLPAVLVATVDNQIPVATAAAAAGAALHSRPTAAAIADGLAELTDDPDRRQAMGAAGQRLIDGRGAGRVVAAIRSREVELRPTGPGDSERLFAWASDEVTRSAVLRQPPHRARRARALVPGPTAGSPLGPLRSG